MWVRTQLKIGWTDLAAGALACLYPGDRQTLQAKVEAYFDQADPALSHETMTAFSVRSGFDTLIQALGLEEGDEVVFSALNVKGMITVARKAGLVAVPLDLDVDHMAPTAEQLQRVITPKTKLLVVAHLFGTRLDLTPIFALAREHGLVIVEDCAQAFNGRGYPGHPMSDVALYSFGPIKTATALGGALVRVRDRDLLRRMRDIQAAYPVQKNSRQLKRVVQFAGLKIVTSRLVLGLLYRFYAALGRSYEDELANRARDVAPLGKVKQRRYQPSAGLLALMARRLYRFSEDSVAARAAAGRQLRDLIGDAVVMPAQANDHHDYWVFPILVDNPKSVMNALRARGFDAADLPRSQTVAAPQGRELFEPRTAAQVLSDLLVLPCYPDMPTAELVRQADLVRELAQTHGVTRTKAYAKPVAAAAQ